MDNVLDFLNGDSPVEPAAAEPTPAPEPESPIEAAEPPQEGVVRDEKGRFAPKAEAQPAPEPEPEPAADPEPTPPPAPQAAPEPDPRLLQLEAQVQGLNKALTEARQQKRQPEPAPNPYEDFEAYQEWEQSQRAGERASWSEKLAVAVHGSETVEKVKEWAASRAEADPIFRQQTWSSPDPYGFAVEEYQRHEALQMLADPGLRAKFQAFLNGAAEPQPNVATPAPAVAAPAPAPPPIAPPTPPRSIASAPSAGGPAAIPTGPGHAFGGVFNRG